MIRNGLNKRENNIVNTNDNKDNEFKDMTLSIIKMCKDILTNLGYVTRTDSPNITESVKQKCEYNGYGFKIVSYDLPPYIFEDKDNGGLIPSIKNYMSKMRIYYEYKEVFDLDEEIYIKGIWEDVLLELYKKCPHLKEEKDKKYKNDLHCKEMLKNVIRPLYKNGIRNINSSIDISYYEERSNEIDNCGGFVYYDHYIVMNDGIEVLHLVTGDYNYYSSRTYIPGEWERELIIYMKEFQVKLEQQNIEKGKEHIRQLRNLK